ncbi:hypothetical protein H6F98_07460 [Microcoleus sp. FACHB-SPT15]|nr:hypothetical protein [Microcoleus sp. FACHB-SPT15]MBD1805285.1 hypothetical protein [Microcoleus sp. FACHB-SPT15]
MSKSECLEKNSYRYLVVGDNRRLLDFSTIELGTHQLKCPITLVTDFRQNAIASGSPIH